MNIISSKNLVAQANALIRAKYKTTRNEELLLKAMISLIEPSDKEFMTLTASVSQLAKVLGMDKNSAHREFDKITTRLMSKVIKIETDDGWYKFQWVSRARLKDGVVFIQFHDDLKPYLLALRETGYFTQYRLEDIVWFRSAYTSRIYELLVEADNKKQSVVQYTVDDFRDRMLGEESTAYPLFKDFRKKVINVAQNELSQKTEEGVFRSKLGFEIITHRTGRKITDLEFNVIKQKTKPTVEKLINHSDGEENESNSETGDNSVIKLLSDFGIDKKKSEKISRSYDLEYIKEKIALYESITEYKEVKSPCGWLIKAIEGNFKDPDEARRKEKQKQQQEEIDRLIAENKKKTEEQNRRKAEIMVKNTYLESISEKERGDLLRKMKEDNAESAQVITSLNKGMAWAFLSFYIPDYKGKVEDSL